MTRNLDFFIRLAHEGKRPGSSTGEQACRHLADVISKHAWCLDSSAFEGFLEFARLMKKQPTTAKEMIE